MHRLRSIIICLRMHLAIAMSTFKEGWCRVLHEAAIHGTPILGSGLGGMRELLQLSSVRPSTFNTLNRDVMKKLMEPKLSDDIQKNFAGLHKEIQDKMV